jgi:hypothetical protein
MIFILFPSLAHCKKFPAWRTSKVQNLCFYFPAWRTVQKSIPSLAHFKTSKLMFLFPSLAHCTKFMFL